MSTLIDRLLDLADNGYPDLAQEVIEELKLRAEQALELREKIAEQEGRLLNQQSTIEGLKHLDAITCGCHYNKVWMGTKWDHWLVPCKDHSPKKVEALEAQLKAAREAIRLAEIYRLHSEAMCDEQCHCELEFEDASLAVVLAGEALAGEANPQ